LVNEYQLRLGRQRQVWLIPTADERMGVQVKLWNPLRTCTIPERFCGGSGGTISSVCTFTFNWYVEKLHSNDPLWHCCLSNRKATRLLYGGGDLIGAFFALFSILVDTTAISTISCSNKIQNGLMFGHQLTHIVPEHWLLNKDVTVYTGSPERITVNMMY